MTAPVEFDTAKAAWERLGDVNRWPSDQDRRAGLVYAGEQCAADPSFFTPEAAHRILTVCCAWKSVLRDEWPVWWVAFVDACGRGHSPVMLSALDRLVRDAAVAE